MIEAQPYRPSNGTEGECFMAAWCARCVRDAEARGEYDTGCGCEILLRTMACQIDDDDYPKEWQIIDGRSRCTAFLAEGDEEPLDPAAAVGLLL